MVYNKTGWNECRDVSAFGQSEMVDRHLLMPRKVLCEFAHSFDIFQATQ